MKSCPGQIKVMSMILKYLLLIQVHSLAFTCQFHDKLHVLISLLFELHQEPCFHQVHSAAQGPLYWPENKTYCSTIISICTDNSLSQYCKINNKFSNIT